MNERGSQIRIFLEALFSAKPDELYILIWTIHDKRSEWFRDIEEAVRYIESLAHRDIYVGVGLSPSDFGPAHRCISTQVAGLIGFWTDLDLKSDAHQKLALPATIEDAMKILPDQVPPTFVIRTGNGAHAWWLFREPLIFESDEERDNVKKLVQRWQTLLRLNASTNGWTLDRVADLARLLRVPGTQNCKDPKNPKSVEIVLQTDRRYNPSDLAEYLDERGVPDAEEQERTAQEWKDKFADKLLTLNPSATVPEDFLNRHMVADARFNRTWLRQRDDLKDQSQSAYDMALANFGADAGLSEQQIVDMIIHHRSIHSQRPRTRLDYFQRTISKAFKMGSPGSTNPLGRPTVASIDTAGAADAGPGRAKPNSAAGRALLCDQISNALGVRILRILKITGKEPTYQLELEAAKVEVPNVSKLVDQKSLRVAIAGAVDRLIPKFKPKFWEQIAQAMLDALTVEDGGEETDFVGSARIHVDNYLRQTPFIESVIDQPLQTHRKPGVIGGQIAICSDDLQWYLNKTSGENHTIQSVASMLTAIGASSTRVKAASFRDQSRWLLPANEFRPEDYTGPGEALSNA